MLRKFCVAAILTATISVALAPSGGIKGKVTNPAGAPIPAAYVLIRPGASVITRARTSTSTSTIHWTTDEAGQFAGTLDSGFCDLCVMADGFAPECRKVVVKDAATIECSFHLKLDPAVINALGDVF